MTSESKVQKFLDTLEGVLIQKGISVPEFAKMIGVPRATVYSWLNGINVMSLEKYYRALEALSITEQLTVDENSQGDSKDA